MFNPPKPTSYGITYSCVADSKSGLTVKFEIATDHELTTTTSATTATSTTSKTAKEEEEEEEEEEENDYKEKRCRC